MLSLHAPRLADSIRPGQFVMVKVQEGTTPLLRRPLSVSRINPPLIELLFRIKGRGTHILSQKKKKDNIDLLGPLGNGFPLEETGSIYAVTGGIGIAPIPALADALHVRNRSICIVSGYGAVEEIPCIQWPRGTAVYTATIDGSFGHKGTVIDLLKTLKKPDVIIGCGPTAMLRALKSYCMENGIRCYLSLESMMACGTGLCGGCVVKKAREEGYLKVCKNGPVFEASKVAL